MLMERTRLKALVFLLAYAFDGANEAIRRGISFIEEKIISHGILIHKSCRVQSALRKGESREQKIARNFDS